MRQVAGLLDALARCAWVVLANELERPGVHFDTAPIHVIRWAVDDPRIQRWTGWRRSLAAIWLEPNGFPDRDQTSFGPSGISPGHDSGAFLGEICGIKISPSLTKS